MSAVSVVGAVETPLGDTGGLLPIFEDEGGACFALGRSEAESRINREDLDAYASEGAVVKFVSVPLTDAFCDIDHFYSDETLGPKPFSAPAYVLYISQRGLRLLDLQEGHLDVLAQRHGGLRLTPTAPAGDAGEYLYSMFTRDSLVNGVLESLMKHAKERLDDYFVTRLRDGEPLDRKVEDESDALSRMMQKLAWDANSAYRAIQYGCQVVLNGPNAANYRVWLEAILRRWGIPGTPEEWRNRSLAIVDSAITKVANDTLQQEIQRRINQARMKMMRAPLEKPESNRYFEESINEQQVPVSLLYPKDNTKPFLIPASTASH